MKSAKNILFVVGSASSDSSNLHLAYAMRDMFGDRLKLTIYNQLKTLPHFDPELSVGDTPQDVLALRSLIDVSDGVIICTPEYVFSIPSGLKNAIEWCISTTIFTDKPTGLITASANGEKGHEELQLIMHTLGAKTSGQTTLLIRGIKGKVDAKGRVSDESTRDELKGFIEAYSALMQ